MSFCAYRGCMNKIRMRRNYINTIKRHEISKDQSGQKMHLFQDDGENTTDEMAREVSLLI